MNKERLLNVAKALRESPNPDAFTMETIHSCGTPCCALGHYAARTDLQQAFYIDPTKWGFRLVGRTEEYDWLRYDGSEVCEHFDITDDDARHLFADETEETRAGCGGASTANEAAEFIERFVADRS